MTAVLAQKPVLGAPARSLRAPARAPMSSSRPRSVVSRTRTVVARAEGATTSQLTSEFVGCALFQVIGGAAPAALAAPANGFALIGLIYAIAGISGAHLNPAVSLMLFLRGRISAAATAAYMVAQVGGCVLGALLCTVIIPGVAISAGLGAPGTFAPAAGLPASAVFAWECLMTCGLGLAVYGAAVARSAFLASAPIGIGAAVTAAIMTAGPYTGAVLNPARALGPAIVFGLSASTVGLYVAAQLAGGVLAALLAGAMHAE